MALAVRALAVVALWLAVARAQPAPSASGILRDGNTAALAGDWPRVSQLVDLLLQRPLAPGELAEANRLAGLAAFFQHRPDAAELRFVAYLRIEPDGRLDPALYPPEVVAFLNDVASRHAAELRALLHTPSRSWLLTLLPPFGQLQNGERTKAYALGGALGALLIANLTTYYYLASWCEHTDGKIGGGLSCYDGGDHNHAAARLRPYNIASGIGVIAVYAYGVLDGVLGYRRRSRELELQPFAAASTDRGVFGVSGRF